MKLAKDKVKIHNNENINSIILLIYIYLPFFWNILENVFGFSALVNYILQVCLGLIIILCNKINKKVLLFAFVFIFFLTLNYQLVDYKYYVLIEGLQAFLGIIIPCLIISSNKFVFNNFIKTWYEFSQRNILLVILSIILLKFKLVHYSIFTAICVPNVFIISIMFLLGNNKSKNDIFNALINILVTIIFGGRMAGVVSLCMLLMVFVYSSKINLKKKFLFYIITFIAAVIILDNFENIIIWTNNKLLNYGLKSRSLTLFIEQMKSKELYITGRDDIYKVCFKYIKDRSGLPGGFGVPLYLTNGKYYYSHNFILQMLITFGSIGTFIVTILLYNRIHTIKKHESKEYYKIILFMLVTYFLIGMLGSSIWIHYISTIFIALVFFRNNIKQEKLEKERCNL